MNWLGFRCVLCHAPLAIATHGLCCRCYKSLARFTYCGHCGMETTRPTLHCGYCLQQEPSWDRMVIIARYLPPLSQLIHQFKFHHSFFLDRTLARLLLLAIYDAKRHYGLPLPEVLIPVPLHHVRQWQRGYNQADLLAQQLAHWLKLPVESQWVVRVKRTHTQRGLSAKERRVNLRQAFRLAHGAESRHYKSVALIDDVITTGSTLNEIAKLLRTAGVEHIQVWGLARC
ncbi:phosphoribosyltransferase family protein [Pasteurella sp. PK-2025]|uniref:phosphoribosyltransferase family protein n=1 Tax=unclassified Pasteurella TaxID=2621516 RepID=UPI003C7380C3